MLRVIVHAADIADRNAVHLVLGWTVEDVNRPQRWAWLPEGAEPPPMPTGRQVLKRRWVVERPFAWLGHYRRLSKDDEALSASEEAWISLAPTRLPVRRLARWPLSRHPLMPSARGILSPPRQGAPGRRGPSFLGRDRAGTPRLSY